MMNIKICINCGVNAVNPGRSWCQSCYHAQSLTKCKKCGVNVANSGRRWCQSCFNEEQVIQMNTRMMNEKSEKFVVDSVVEIDRNDSKKDGLFYMYLESLTCKQLRKLCLCSDISPYGLKNELINKIIDNLSLDETKKIVKKYEI